MTKKLASFLCLISLCLLSGQLHSAIVDQSQATYEGANDLHSDGSSGQTFTAGCDGDLVGIRLLLEGAAFGGNETTYPIGSAFQVSLRKVSRYNVVSETIIATGYRSKDGIEHNVVKWFEILFDQPYHQSEGEKLAFTIAGLSGGGSHGWNNYAMSRENPYASGQQFYWFSNQPLGASNYDMAFETIVVPEPSTMLFLTIGVFFTKRKKLGIWLN